MSAPGPIAAVHDGFYKSSEELTGRRGVSATVVSPGCAPMHEIIYLIGLIVVVMFLLGALGLR